MSAGILTAFTFIAAIFAYLAINLDEEHGEFKLLNLGISYLTMILTALFATEWVKQEYPDTALAEMISSTSQGYVYILMFILGYFVLYILYKIMDDMVKL